MNSINYISPLGTERRHSWTEDSSTSEKTNDTVETHQLDDLRVAELDIGDHKSPGHTHARETSDEVVNRLQSAHAVTQNDRAMVGKRTPFIEGSEKHKHDVKLQFSRPPLLRRLAAGIVSAVKVVASVVFAPAIFVFACFHDEKRRFSLFYPLRKVSIVLRWSQTDARAQAMVNTSMRNQQEKNSKGDPPRRRSSEPESDERSSLPSRPTLIERRSSRAQSTDQDSPSRHTRSKSLPTSAAETREPITPRRSIRISVLNEDALLQRRLERQKRDAGGSNATVHLSPNAHLSAKSIKSPTSPASSLLKYPRAPAPPRPLVPKRQPSYTYTNAPSSNGLQKTLILDLDETLIHSMSKGGRMSTGHMVEVKLQNPVGVEGMALGPQVPILYYVHKRPHCDEFLRKVSKWYNLIVFTAAVQEYADPVIDWLELERKYFSARYYRQHCTFRNGAYIKDVGQVEPDLSKVMILDNSPISYTFHEDNAIPIEGWISDPSDNDLLHLVPLLEGLQYATDVRALLALRLGEAAV